MCEYIQTFGAIIGICAFIGVIVLKIKQSNKDNRINETKHTTARLINLEEQVSKLVCVCEHGIKWHTQSDISGDLKCLFKTREIKWAWQDKSVFCICNCNKFRIG